ncbi:DUF1428 domain-containing protein [Halorubrum sp. DTA98]|uniref:DUF1428 domain-containing protein n=1 Tax=Halorubrum sp. DTA98 TaxID=3402163 RepID=UPI003AABB96A
MERYVDGFVIPVPNDALDAYREMAEKAGEIWIKHGALEYFEGVGDDMDPDVDGMPIVTFPQLAETGDDETVVFSFIAYESRDHRDEVNAKVMGDPEMDPDDFDGDMPFDTERMSYGGFRSIVSYEN